MAVISSNRFGVKPEKERALCQRYARLGICETDLLEKFIRSSGPGGQNVNKVSTAVHLKHKPSGIDVKASSARTQALNRYLARILLADKIENQILGKKSKEQARIAKIRRQKRRRSRRAQEKLLSDKHHQGEKKRLRGPPNSE